MSNKFIKKLGNDIGEQFFKLLFKNAPKMTYATIEKKSKFISSLFYLLCKKRIKNATNNIKLAFGDKYSAKEIKAMVKEVTFNFVVEFYMFFYIAGKSKDEVGQMVEFEGKEYIDEVLEDKKGCIFLTAHFGNWEILARKLCIEGYIVNVIARDSDNVGMTDITSEIRNDGGYNVFSRDQSLVGIVKALRRNECLGILPDQHSYEGIWVNFFGRKAKTSVGTATFALRTGAKIVPIFCHRAEMGKYKLIAYPSLEYKKTGDDKEDIRNLTQLINDTLENHIRKYPTSWLWIHNRWK